MKAEVTYLQDGWRDVKVPLEDGPSYAVVQFRRMDDDRGWHFEFSDELLQLAPERLHAVLGLALMEMRHNDGSPGAGNEALAGSPTPPPGLHSAAHRLYTAEEVGDLQASEAELVAKPLRAEIARLKKLLSAHIDGRIVGSTDDV